MRLHRFIIQGAGLRQSSLTITDDQIIHQLTRVLRLTVGSMLLIGDGACHEAEAIISSMSKRSIIVNVVKRQTNVNEPTRHVVLYCSVIKHEHFAMVVEKATEAGVKEIVPILAQRSVKTNVKLERLNTITKEAAEQSGRGVIPMIHPIMKLEEALQHAKDNDVNLFFDTIATNDTPRSFKSFGARAGLFIGPEGGWDDAERALAREYGMIIMSLGGLTLRAETAAIVATYLTINDLTN